MFKYISLFILSLFSIYSKGQDCLLKVPDDPLNTGLFSPWYVSTAPNSETNCSQLIDGTEVFAEATILDKNSGKIFIYSPLVIDIDTEPAVKPKVLTLPINNVVTIHFGTNAESITLISERGITQGSCINGFSNSIFGQFAHCNAVNFFEIISSLIYRNIISIPPIKNSNLCDICPTTRSFSVVDQDQSDNVLTKYIITTDLKLAQDSVVNKNKLNILKIISNGSDNKVLSDFVNPAIGCDSFFAQDFEDININRFSLVLNELQANLTDSNSVDTALIPSGNPMCLINGEVSIGKINAYREGVAQPIITQIDPEDNKKYCSSMLSVTIPFLILHKNEFENFPAPGKDSNNLLNFLIGRFINSWDILNCNILTGNNLLLKTIINNEGVIVDNNLKNFINKEADIKTYCENNIDVNIYPINNFCGINYYNLNCTQSCPMGLDNECLLGTTCFNTIDKCNNLVSKSSINKINKHIIFLIIIVFNFYF